MVSMTSFYFCVIIFIALVAYAGIDETMRLLVYLDLQLRFAYIRIRMFFMKKTLERQLAQYKKGEWQSFINEVKQNATPNESD